MVVPTEKDYEDFDQNKAHLYGLTSLQTYEKMLEVNFKQLTKHMDVFELDESLKLMDMKNRSILNGYLFEFLRLLHNYLSSAYSLKTHTYTLCNRYESLKESEKLQSINNLFKHPDAYLIQELRNYVQHVGLESVQTQVKVDYIEDKNTYSEKLYLGISKQELISWNELKPRVKQVLDKDYSGEDTIHIRPLLDRYQKLVKEYYKSFYELYSQVFQSELETCRRFLEMQASIQKSFMQQIESQEAK